MYYDGRDFLGIDIKPGDRVLYTYGQRRTLGEFKVIKIKDLGENFSYSLEDSNGLKKRTSNDNHLIVIDESKENPSNSPLSDFYGNKIKDDDYLIKYGTGERNFYRIFKVKELKSNEVWIYGMNDSVRKINPKKTYILPTKFKQKIQAGYFWNGTDWLKMSDYPFDINDAHG